MGQLPRALREVLTHPPLSPVALAEVKDWLGVTTDSEDSALASLLRAALESCEAFTGTIPIECTCEEVLPVCGAWVKLATRPVHAITGADGIDAAGTRTALASSAFAVDFDADGAGLVRVIDPGLNERVAVRFSAGLAASWTALPDGLRHGVIRLAAHQFRSRENLGAEPAPPAAVAAMWRPWRQLRLA